MTAADIYSEILKTSPSASQSSIYRNIEDMVKKRELNKLEGIWKQAYFEAKVGQHIHLIDQETWKIIDVDINHWDITIPNLPSNFISDSFDIKIFWKFE